MITQGPFDLTIGTVLPLSDPGANSNNPATAVQLQNASPFIIEVNSGGNLLTIQSFTAQTVSTAGGGQQMSVEPIAANVTTATLSPASLSVVWLLAGESAPMVDGPLTAAAITTGLANAGISGADVVGASVSVASGASGGAGPGGAFQMWGWGFEPATLLAGAWPTLGGVSVTVLGGTVVQDSLGYLTGASTRLAGLRATAGVTFFNYTDKTVVCFLNYSVLQ